MNALTDKRPFEISFCLNKWFSTCLPCRYQRVSEWWLVQLHGWVSQVRQHSWLLQVWMWSRLVLYWWKMQRYLIIFRRKFPGSWGMHCSVILLFAFWYLTVEFWAWQSYQAQISKAQSTSREAFNNKTGSCCYISNHSYLSPGGGSDFFRGEGRDYMIFRGYGRRSVVANRVYRGGHKNITQPYGRIWYKQTPPPLAINNDHFLTLFITAHC